MVVQLVVDLEPTHVKHQPESHEPESKAGSFGNHKRWHVNRKVNDPECSHCKESA